jgi:GT2 family glycosyltransferase
MTVRISVVIPTYERLEFLAQCLDRLCPGKQSLPASDYEVIVTDDGKRVLADKLISSQYSWARWENGPKRGPAANRNNGARQAKGEWLAFLDDDCLPEANWLSSILACADQYRVDVVEGKIVNPCQDDNPFLLDIHNLTGGVYWTGNLSVRKSTFLSLGAFDEDFLEAGEDLEFAFRIRKNKVAARFCPEAFVTHIPQFCTWKSLFRRTLSIKWTLLYHHKSEMMPPYSASPLLLLYTVAKWEITNLLRITWHFFSRDLKRDGLKRLKSNLFKVAWKWLTFPIVLPYMLIWEMRFRRQYLQRSCGTL